MLLRRVVVKNFRSIEHAEICGLTDVNTFVRRNNSGKSSVFAAVRAVRSAVLGSGETQWERALTDHDRKRSLELTLEFTLRPNDRSALLDKMNWDKVREGRRTELQNSPFAREMEFFFKADVGNPSQLHLHRVSMSAEDAQEVTIESINTNEAGHVSNPNHLMRNFEHIDPAMFLNANVLDGMPGTEARVPVSFGAQAGSPNSWWRERLVLLLESAFFFNPFRHSQPQLAVTQSEMLLSDGSNLAQVLHTLNSGSRRKFAEIEKFMQAALPGIGALQTPLIGTQTKVAFEAVEDLLMDLHDMGGGVEQLLMTAIVLLTAPREAPVFLEEPESHLHSAAQRFLFEQLHQKGRQVFITTHSPVFINSQLPTSLFQVTFKDRRTQIREIAEDASLADVLGDIGARNSDVLLSDAVLFVEGPSDAECLVAWSHALRIGLAEHGVTVLPMGGGENADRKVPIRSEVLMGVSRRAPVPHMFVLDRDERSEAEINSVSRSLGDRVVFLSRRELENYLLVPSAIRRALVEKLQQDPGAVEHVRKTSAEAMTTKMLAAAEALKPLVLMKRIRARLGGLPGGLLPREEVPDLLALPEGASLEDEIARRIRSRFEARLNAVQVAAVVAEERRVLDAAWSGDAILDLAPGEEVISSIFREFSATFKKTKDAPRIARAMHEPDIPAEINEVLRRVVALRA
jgi:predicted ATPase